MMPPEGPNNKSEELLQRYAKERREQGGDFSLHPATRRVLQGEVAKQFKKPAEEKSGWWVWLALWRGKLAVAGAVAAAVVIACWVYWDNSKSDRRMEMAQASAPAPAEREVAFGRREIAERGAKDDSLADRLSTATALEAKKEVAVVSEKLAELEVKRKQQVAPLNEFGTVASFYSVVPATNTAGSSLSLQLGDSVADYLPGSVPTTNVSIASRGYSAGFGLNYAQSTNRGAEPEALGAQYGFRLNAGEPMQGLAVADRADAAQAASRLTEAGKPATRSLDSLARGRNENVANLGAAFTTPAAPAAPARPALPGTVPLAEMPALAATPPPAAVVPSPAASAFGGAAAPANAPVAAGPLPESLSRRSRDETRYFRVAPTGAVAGRDVAAETSLAKAAENSPVSFRVLARFAIEQQTNTVRLLDSDGSVYEGPLNTAEAAVEFSEADKDSYERQKVVTLKKESKVRGEEHSFRATGSNVTLRQIVEVSGRFAPGTNGTTAATRGLAVNGTVTAAPVERRFVVPAQTEAGRAGGLPASGASGPAAIDGTVRVGRGTTERFRALRETK